MKIDAFHLVQLWTAYRGLQTVPDEDVIELYSGMQHIPLYQMSDFYGKGPSLKQFMDILSLPEMTLLSSVTDHFITHGIEFDQLHLYKDISDAIRDVHVKGAMCKWIEKDLEQCILHGDEIYAVLNHPVNHKKKLFLFCLTSTSDHLLHFYTICDKVCTVHTCPVHSGCSHPMHTFPATPSSREQHHVRPRHRAQSRAAFASH
ncbi:hypothetical protein Q9233_001581 [Columba guinea]|nr:hypothetical protein Q9233_001581 [Columba guinea]